MDNIMSVRRKYINLNDIIEVACMGGMLENDTLLLRLLNKYLNDIKNITVVQPVGTALDGALQLGHNLINEYED
jgi:hydrogenase maturation factor HypF (carbamoyltransferase family)